MRTATATALVLALVASACGSRDEPRRAEDPARSTTATATTNADTAASCTNGERRSLGDRFSSYGAVVKERLNAHSRPGGKVLRAFGPKTHFGLPTIFAVRAEVVDERCEPIWYDVQLPIRPNGATGYVRASAVEVYELRTRIEVDVSQRKLAFFRDGRRVLQASVAVGTARTPTPTGRFYVNARVRTPDPNGPWGPFALGISAFSPVLTYWPQGGPVAIHGTNARSSIGKRASNGCIRLLNETMRWVFAETLMGTPVVIRA